MISPSVFQFLEELKLNNHKDWMQANKKQYLANEKQLKDFYKQVETRLNQNDKIEKIKVFRINRDIRFSKDKTPYNVHRSVSFSREGVHRRGGYYLRIEPNNSLMAAGFFEPNPTDLLRIRQEFDIDAQPIRNILNEKDFKKAFGGFNQEYAVKTVPKGFSKDHPDIDLIKLKSFFVTHQFRNQEVTATNFIDQLVYHYELARPYFDYMSEVLTSNLNGESVI